MPGMKGAQGVVSLHLFCDKNPADVNTSTVLTILIFFHPQGSTIKKSLNSSTV